MSLRLPLVYIIFSVHETQSSDAVKYVCRLKKAVNWNEWHVFSSLFAFIFIYLLYYSASLIALPHTYIVSILFSPSFSEFPSFMNEPVGRLCWVSCLFSHSYLCCERERVLSHPFNYVRSPLNLSHSGSRTASLKSHDCINSECDGPRMAS